MGSLGIYFEVGWGITLSPYLNVVRIMLETSENIPFSTKALLILLMLAFFGIDFIDVSIFW